MNEAALAIPVIVVALGLVTTVAMTIRNRRHGRTPFELLGNASIFIMITSVMQTMCVLGAFAIVIVMTDQPMSLIDQIDWIPAKAFNVLAWGCLALAAVALIRQQRASSDEPTPQVRRPWLALALIACFVGAFQWTQSGISEIVADSRHAIYYEESDVAFRAVTSPALVKVLGPRNIKDIAMANVGGRMVGMAVNERGASAFEWDPRGVQTEAGAPIALPRAFHSAFAMAGYLCGIDKQARASCIPTTPATDAPTGIVLVDGRTSAFLPAPVCNGHVRACALVEPGVARCFIESSGKGFREESLPLEDGIRIMTPQFGCLGCFVEKNGHIRCLMQGLGGEIISNGVEGVDDAVAIASSLEHACAIERDGRVFCWDLDAKARLAHENMPWKSRAIPDIRARQISVAQTHACAIDESGKVYCWGSNQWGELCDGSRIDRASPVPAIGVSDAVMVSVENSVTCIVGRAGEVACCGKQRRRW